MTKKTFESLLLILSMILVVSTTIGCSKGVDQNPQGGDEPTNFGVTLKEDIVGAAYKSDLLYINTAGDWRVTITHIPSTTVWCTADKLSGNGKTTVVLTCAANTVSEDRTASIKVKTSEKEYVLSLTQLAKIAEDDGGGGGGVAPVVAGWMELPQNIAGANYRYITHMTTVDQKQVRNYSMLFDTQEGIAYWVAYPHHKSYIGSSGRTDAWGYDPKIQKSMQPNYANTVSGYDRGHQIPSGDRTCDKATNRQTFYYTNMTPQLGDLNRERWAALETQVREWTKSSSCDTLYVVTGAILKTVGGNQTVNHVLVGGKSVAVPNFYYKVLLRLSKSGQYDAIGFWYEHRSYGSGNAVASETKSVDEIERLTGFDFFNALPQATQASVEASCRPQDWGL